MAKTYVMERGSGVVRATVLNDRPYPLVHRVHHSPDGFEMGYGGSGPSDLARSILWDYLGAEPDPALYQTFKWQFIASAPEEGFEITASEIDNWLASSLCEDSNLTSE